MRKKFFRMQLCAEGSELAENERGMVIEMYAEERKKKIVEYLEKNGRAGAGELAKLLNTSRETIRRDLNDLSQRGMIIKTHGGALVGSEHSAWLDTPIAHREMRNPKIKQALCARAAEFIEEQDTIFLDNSSTVAHLIKYIPKSMTVTIITNSIKVLLEIAKFPSTKWKVMHLGGMFTPDTLSTSSHLTINNLKAFIPKKAFMSCHGIQQDLMITDSYMDDVELKKTAAEVSHEVFLLADHTKFENTGVIRILPLERFDHIIIDDGTDDVKLEELSQKAYKVHVINV